MPTINLEQATRLMKKKPRTEIEKIQLALKGLGLYMGRADGLYGPLTHAAVKRFQRINRLNQDGVVGPKTWNALFPPTILDRELRANPPTHIIQPNVPIHNPWPRQKDCMEFYGAVGKNQVMLELPYPMRLAWDKRVVVKKFSIHTKVADSAFDCLSEIHKLYGKKIPELGLDIFGGCLMVRKMRGGNSWSMHSWGIAIDFDPENNLLRWDNSKASMAKPEYTDFWEIWESRGWLSLGRARNYDWMHVQAAQL